MEESIKLGTYLVAFIDIVGQRDQLHKITALPKTSEEEKSLMGVLQETSQYVKELRKQFFDFFNSTAREHPLQGILTPEQQKWYKERRHSIVWHRGFSDSYVITVPCSYDKRYGVHMDGVYSCLYGLSTLFLWSLAMKKPFRGGVEVQLGTEIEEQEVYGPVTARAYELQENHYPCIFIGEGLLNHLDKVARACPDDIDGKHTLINIEHCRQFITKDNYGHYILDVMGEGVKSVPTEITYELVEKAYHFVVNQQEHFSKIQDTHLLDYYSKLRECCESRLLLWNINSEH